MEEKDSGFSDETRKRNYEERLKDKEAELQKKMQERKKITNEIKSILSRKVGKRKSKAKVIPSLLTMGGLLKDTALKEEQKSKLNMDIQKLYKEILGLRNEIKKIEKEKSRHLNCGFFTLNFSRNEPISYYFSFLTL